MSLTYLLGVINLKVYKVSIHNTIWNIGETGDIYVTEFPYERETVCYLLSVNYFVIYFV